MLYLIVTHQAHTFYAIARIYCKLIMCHAKKSVNYYIRMQNIYRYDFLFVCPAPNNINKIQHVD